jgi:hypothetical protein
MNKRNHLDDVRQAIIDEAVYYDWLILKSGYNHINLIRNDIKMNICYNKPVTPAGNFSFTVQTALIHPKKGKTQLTRNDINLRTLLKLFENPREHTGKGYYKKRK